MVLTLDVVDELQDLRAATEGCSVLLLYTDLRREYLRLPGMAPAGKSLCKTCATAALSVMVLTLDSVA